MFNKRKSQQVTPEKSATRSDIARGESPYRQRLIDLCVEHNIPLQETFYGDVLHSVSINGGTWSDTEYKTDIIGGSQDPYKVLYTGISHSKSRRVVKLV